MDKADKELIEHGEGLNVDGVIFNKKDIVKAVWTSYPKYTVIVEFDAGENGIKVLSRADRGSLKIREDIQHTFFDGSRPEVDINEAWNFIRGR